MGGPLRRTWQMARAVALLCVCGPDTEQCQRRQSGASVGTTDQGKGRVSREARVGQAGRGRAQGGELGMKV